VSKLDYWPMALSEARTNVREAHADWRSSNYFGAVSHLWSCHERCQECLMDDAPVLVREVLAAMMLHDDELVEHWSRELSEYLKQDPTKRQVWR